MAAIESLCMFITFVASSLGSNPPETDMTTIMHQKAIQIEIIAYHGYTAEVINVKTEDGYILQMHRIPYAKNESIHTLNRKRPVVFLQHGLLGSSADWVLNHPNQTSAFLFADAGFDVWMGNMRGNINSTQHETYPRNTKEYWQFSWDEMSKYDLEAMIDKVLNITKQPYVHYVGHSQGTLIMFTKLASDQKFATKIRKFFALAPVGACSHIEGLFSVLGDIVKKLPFISGIFGDKEFLPDVRVMKLFSKYICGFKDINPLCNSILFLIGGPENQFDQSRIPVYMAHVPAGTSTQNMMHWSQMYNSGETQAYNYGSEPENQKHYGQVTPPFYNLSRVNALTYLYWSDKDWLADEKDIKASLLGRIPSQYIKQNNKLVNFNHLDFLWGKRAADEIYKPIIDSITSYERSQGHLYGS